MSTGQNHIRIGVLLLVATALLAAGWIGVHATPSSEAVRLRNALVAEVVDAGTLDWRPSSQPDFYQQESAPPPARLVDLVDRLDLQPGQGNATNKATELAVWLRPEKRRGGALMTDTLSAIARIPESGRGYCADYTQAFNALGYVAGLDVREWGMSFDGFGGKGHAFSEVYDDSNGQWFFIDTFNGFMLRDSASGDLLSVLELRKRLVEQGEAGLRGVQVQQIPKGSFGFRDDENMWSYYLQGRHQMFLIGANDNLSYDQNALINLAAKVSRAAEQATAILLGIQPRLYVIGSPENREMLADLTRVKYQLLAALTALLLSVTGLFGLLISRLWRARMRP